jgi:hypothetical protein
VSSLQVQLGSLSTEVAGKQSQLRAGLGEGAHPFLVGAYDEDLVLKDTVRALRVAAPLVVTQSPFVVDLSLDASLATQNDLEALQGQVAEAQTAADVALDQALLVKDNLVRLDGVDEALQGQVDTLAAGLATKQGQLTPGQVAGGHQLLQGTTVRAIKGAGPVKVAADAGHVEVWLAQNELAATPAIAALQTAVGTKQSQLFAGEVEGGHRLLLQPSLFVGGGFDEGTSPDEPLQGDTVRALKVSSPLVATSNNSHVHLSLDPGWSPFWICGTFDGVNLAKLSDSGHLPYTVSRPTGGVGVYRVAWSTPHPLGANYTIQLTSETGIPFIRGRTDISSTGFNIAVRDANNYGSNADRVVHVVVI